VLLVFRWLWLGVLMMCCCRCVYVCGSVFVSVVVCSVVCVLAQQASGLLCVYLYIHISSEDCDASTHTQHTHKHKHYPRNKHRHTHKHTITECQMQLLAQYRNFYSLRQRYAGASPAFCRGALAKALASGQGHKPPTTYTWAFIMTYIALHNMSLQVFKV
jgi:hypothetical protein